LAPTTKNIKKNISGSVLLGGGTLSKSQGHEATKKIPGKETEGRK
jgi:hypothetical protein